MSTDDGGPAFPDPQEDWRGAKGMTLRDYFAAKAMYGILAGDHPITHDKHPLPIVAHVAYELADAMLKARQS